MKENKGISKARLEAFSDGVLAVTITIMVLEVKAPHGSSFEHLCSMAPIFLSYVISFFYIGTYWSNHHHMVHTVTHVNGQILLANLHFLFWVSLIPFTTDWMGENHFEPLPTALYGIELLFTAAAYRILPFAILKHNPTSVLSNAIGKDFKGKMSLILFLIAIPTAFYYEKISQMIYFVVILMWIIPDRRIEKLLS